MAARKKSKKNVDVRKRAKWYADHPKALMNKLIRMEAEETYGREYRLASRKKKMLYELKVLNKWAKY